MHIQEKQQKRQEFIVGKSESVAKEQRSTRPPEATDGDTPKNRHFINPDEGSNLTKRLLPFSYPNI
jgi:hypothetical protein